MLYKFSIRNLQLFVKQNQRKVLNENIQSNLSQDLTLKELFKQYTYHKLIRIILKLELSIYIFQLQLCLLFASNIIFWKKYCMTVTSISKSKIIRAFKLTEFYQVPYELRKLVPKFINIKQSCKSIVPQNYVSERINDIFLQTLNFGLNEESGNKINRNMRCHRNSQQNHATIYYVNSDYVKNAKGVQRKFQINYSLNQRQQKNSKIYYQFSFQQLKILLYLKNTNSMYFKTIDFGQQYNSLMMRKPKFQEDNLVFRERYAQKRIIIIRITDQLKQLKDD
ncbi:hypothetical protein pb186bvf_009416 [Paramecium bursaria]